MADDYTQKIQQAQDQGIDSEHILNYLSSSDPDLNTKITTAKRNKQITNDHILEYLKNNSMISGGQGTAESPATNPNFNPAQHEAPPVFNPIDVGKGAIGGAAHTVSSIYDLARRGAGLANITLPEVPQFLSNAANGPINPSPSYKVGRIGEQMAEFAIPESKVGSIAKGIEDIPHIGNATKILSKAVLGGASAAAVTAAQTDGDVETAAKAFLLGTGVAAGFGGLGAAFKAIPLNKVYETKALSGNFPERFREQMVEQSAKAKVLGQNVPTRMDDIMNMAIDDGITSSKKGLGKAAINVDKAMGARDARMAAETHGNTDLVDANVVIDPLNNLRQVMAKVPGAEGFVAKIDKQIEDILHKAGARPGVKGTPSVPGTPAKFNTVSSTNGPLQIQTSPGTPGSAGIPAIPAKLPKISVADAQDLKSTFQTLVKDSFGEVGTGGKQILEASAEGYMKSLEDVLPWLREANKDVQNRILLKDAILKMVSSDNNANAAGLAGAITGHSYVTSFFALTNARIRQNLAIAADRFGKTMTNASKTVTPFAASAPAQFYDPSPLPPIPYRNDQSNAQR